MRVTLAVLLAMFIALIPVASFAQEPVVFCGDLASEDCALLEAAAANEADVVNGAYDVEFDMLLTNIPDMPSGELGVTWLQSGAYASDPELSAALMAEIDVESVDDLQDVDTMMAFIEAFLASVDTQQEITLLLSDAIVDAISMESGFPVPAQLDLSFAIIDGIIYVDLSTLAEFIPEAGALGGWVGTDLAPFVRMGLEQALADPEGQDALMALGGALAMTASPDAMQAATEAQAAQLAMVEEYLFIERLGNEMLDDEEVAVFLTTFDLAGFSSSPGFMDMVKQQMAMAEAMGQDVPSQAELAEMEEVLPMLAPAIFEGFVYDIYQLIGLDSELTRGTAIDLTWDMAGLMEMAAEPGAAMPDGAPLLDVVMSVYSYEQNQLDGITAPEGALVLPAEMILGMAQ